MFDVHKRYLVLNRDTQDDKIIEDQPLMLNDYNANKKVDKKKRDQAEELKVAWKKSEKFIVFFEDVFKFGKFFFNLIKELSGHDLLETLGMYYTDIILCCLFLHFFAGLNQ